MRAAVPDDQCGGHAGSRELVARRIKMTDQEEFEREFAEWIAELEAEIESTRRSEMLTADDYAIVINAR